MEIALYRPEIPPNTGNIARLSLCTQSRLHIVGKASFSMDEAAVRRAGLDYWDQVDLHLHEDWSIFRESIRALSHTPSEETAKGTENRSTGRILLFTTFASKNYSEHEFRNDDILVFGQETSGLPDFIKDDIGSVHPEHILRIPVFENCRSLNLANSVAIVIYEGLRQLGYPGLLD